MIISERHLCISLSVSLPLSHSLALSLIHIHTHSLSLTHTHTHTHTLSLSHIHTHTYTPALDTSLQVAKTSWQQRLCFWFLFVLPPFQKENDFAKFTNFHHGKF